MSRKITLDVDPKVLDDFLKSIKMSIWNKWLVLEWRPDWRPPHQRIYAMEGVVLCPQIMKNYSRECFAMQEAFDKKTAFEKRLIKAFYQWSLENSTVLASHIGEGCVIDIPPEEGNRIMRQLLLKCREMENPPDAQ